MLQELPKKPKKEAGELTKGRLFWRIQKVCFLRAVTPCMMYLFTSLIALAINAISLETLEIYEIVLGSVCILGGVAFNAHLAYNYGKLHYDSYITGCLHRKNRLFGIQSGGDHRVEQEYRPWKGFLIGLYVGIPVIVFGTLAAIPATWSWGEVALMMFASWAILPVQWIRGRKFVVGEGESWVSPPVCGGWSLLFILLPIIVTGVFYIVGAMTEKRRKERAEANGETFVPAAQQKKRK